MPTFEVPGAELAVSLSDEGGHPVVQLHGLTSSRAHDRVLNLDLGRGLSGTRLLRYDARGHGRSTGRKVPEDYHWQSLADDVLRLLDHWFPGERVHGVGPSMGTGTLLHAASREPDRFSGLTLMVPRRRGKPDLHRLQTTGFLRRLSNLLVSTLSSPRRAVGHRRQPQLVLRRRCRTSRNPCCRGCSEVRHSVICLLLKPLGESTYRRQSWHG
ncbi:alpha/beta fold hydrolase [Arthrobacter sp. SA17]